MLLVYQIKVGLCLIAFYLLWKMLLSRETFHRFNRVALLVALALALVLPWIRLSLDAPASVAQGMVTLDEIIVGQSTATHVHKMPWSWNAINVVTAVYFLGVVLTIVWLLHSQWNLHHLLKKGRKEVLANGTTLHVLPGNITPFSYFKHIVINEQDYRDNAHEILIHEQAHIGLRHSWDIVFMELLTLFQWWNPAAWLLCRELRQVHEYEADEAVLNEGVDAKQYQLLLIRKSVGNQLFSMANNFNYQSLKKRIRMMTINKSSQWKRLRALAVVPVIALALLAFANPTTDETSVLANKSVSASPTPQESEVQLPETTPELVVVAYTEEQAPETDGTKKEKTYNSVEQMPEFPGGEAALMQYLMNHVHYPANAAKNKIEGRVIVQFVIKKTGEIGEIKVIRSVDEELDAEAVRVVKTLPNFIPGRQNGKPVAVWYNLPISFKLQGNPPTPK